MVTVPVRCLFFLHSSVLEPYFDLSLSETQSLGEFPSLGFSDIGVTDVFLLQLGNLQLRVWLPLFAHVQNGRRHGRKSGANGIMR